MALHLFDKPDTGPNIHELLEQDLFSGQERPTPEWARFDIEVWTLVSVDCTERGPDSFAGLSTYASKEAALWAWWRNELDTVLSDDGYFDEHLTPTQWLAETLTQLQSLRDDHAVFDGDTATFLTRTEVSA